MGKTDKNKEKPIMIPIMSDLSLHPDYSKFEVPYSVICRERYQRSKRIYDKQFLYELKMQEAMQINAYDAMKFHRHFAITTLWPPLHTRKEIEMTLNKMYPYNQKNKKRLQDLLTYQQV